MRHSEKIFVLFFDWILGLSDQFWSLNDWILSLCDQILNFLVKNWYPSPQQVVFCFTYATDWWVLVGHTTTRLHWSLELHHAERLSRVQSYDVSEQIVLFEGAALEFLVSVRTSFLTDHILSKCCISIFEIYLIATILQNPFNWSHR